MTNHTELCMALHISLSLFVLIFGIFLLIFKIQK
jgi:hypothetical protein